MTFYFIYYVTLYILLGVFTRLLGDLRYSPLESDRSPHAFILLGPLVLIALIVVTVQEIDEKIYEYNIKLKESK